MYFSKVVAAAALLLSASLEASAHAAVSPVLGVAGTPVRSDVQRPNKARPCGRTNVAANLDTSGTITMNADNTFTATITNFNRLLDGSRQIASALVDTTGTGEQFDQDATVLENGTRAPKEFGSDQLKIQMPAAACTGGATGDKCLVSFKTLSGFGNCVVIQNAGSSNSTDTGSDDTDSDSDSDSSDSTSTSTDTASDSASTSTDTASDSASTSTDTDAADSTSTAVDSSAATATDASSVAAAATDSAAAAATSSAKTGKGKKAEKAAKAAKEALKLKGAIQRRAAPSHRLMRRRAGPYRL